MLLWKHRWHISKKGIVDHHIKRKTKWPRCSLIITDNNRKIIKKNTKHNYQIKKEKLNLNKKKNLHPLYFLMKIVTRKQHLYINIMDHCMKIKNKTLLYQKINWISQLCIQTYSNVTARRSCSCCYPLQLEDQAKRMLQDQIYTFI